MYFLWTTSWYERALPFPIVSETLNVTQGNLTELKSFGAPPGAVVNVIAAVMVLMAPGGKVPKDRSWKAGKVAMGKVDAFLDALITYDKENIHEACLKAIRPYLDDKEFDPDFIRGKVRAVAFVKLASVPVRCRTVCVLAASNSSLEKHLSKTNAVMCGYCTEVGSNLCCSVD